MYEKATFVAVYPTKASSRDRRAALFAVSELEDAQSIIGFSEPGMSLDRAEGEEGMIPRERLSASRRWHIT